MEEKTFIVYKHTSPEGKVYIGMTCHKPIVRWRKDGSGYKNNVHFWGAIQKYGWKNFKHEILAENLGKEEAEKLEIEEIEKSNSANKDFGYNIALGGSVNVPTEEIKQKISKANKGRKWTDEQKSKIAGRDKGRFVPEEWRIKMSIAQTGRKHTEETKRKISEGNKGKVVSQETREKIRKSALGRKYSKETIEKRKKSIQGYRHSEETKSKISKSHSKKIICINTNEVYDSATVASKILNISRTSICAVLNNRQDKIHGLKFEYYKGEMQK